MRHDAHLAFTGVTCVCVFALHLDWGHERRVRPRNPNDEDIVLVASCAVHIANPVAPFAFVIALAVHGLGVLVLHKTGCIAWRLRTFHGHGGGAPPQIGPSHVEAADEEGGGGGFGQCAACVEVAPG